MIGDTICGNALYRLIAKAGPKNGNGWVSVGAGTAEIQRRDDFIEHFAFAVPSRSAVRTIRSFVGDRKLLEVGAGTGLWARLLTDAGLAITAVDNLNNKGYRRKFEVGHYFPVERCDAMRAIKRYNDHLALMICWPDYATPMASKALAAFGGDALVYIGEDSGGCTGDNRFHEMLDDWRLVRTVSIPQWPGIHDAAYLYDRG